MACLDRNLASSQYVEINYQDEEKMQNTQIQKSKRYAILETAFQIQIMLLVIIHIMTTKQVRTF